MTRKLSQKDFKKESLSYKAIALVSEFALILYRKYGILIDVNSNDVVLRVLHNTRRCNDRRLAEICLHIKTEVSMNLSNMDAA